MSESVRRDRLLHAVRAKLGGPQRLPQRWDNAAQKMVTTPEDEQAYAAASPAVVSAELPAAVHASYMELASDCYSRHVTIRVNPHDLWYVLLCEVAATVNANSDQYRELFTHAESGKADVVVPTTGQDRLDLDVLMAQLRPLVPADTDTFFPAFSTHTAASRAACMAAFADMVKSYYNYMTLACGLPAVTFGGTAEDWDLFGARAEQLQALLQDCGMPAEPAQAAWNGPNPGVRTAYFERVRARVAMVAALMRGGPAEFVRDFYSQQNVGSGGEKRVDGWLAEFYVNSTGKLVNFNPCWAVVPYKNLDTKRSFSAVFGCFGGAGAEGGSQVGQYGHVILEHLDG